MNKLTVAFLATATAAALQLAVAPSANANPCPAGENGTSVNLADCPIGSIAAADALDEARQRWQGRPPCYTREGVPYYTPGDAPCA
ncbi:MULTISPECIES: hypothetical protein [Mycobacterium]|uniref:Excalibur calcium-binding domain-containing protein n=1 Tax=Mycobacterium gordonae TaxID=1778 RepID=A0A1A6BB68_MYCGO|nr:MULTISPECIES: hypothetical protein [Mycobacterium]MBI2702646.1 hypothetical protein [Mycobacterium sp.]MBX9980549.1 hypothetical protein [Mycobacterium gordonae]MCV7007119.1 hypothetical protein [Mycobacterium gordonae]OBR99564.1 hypothetical protein A9W98_29720 [Mycobacterium gordonae]ODR24490.1 hypothetical protein BHQ23_00340 [Mycobacterium gordonae]